MEIRPASHLPNGLFVFGKHLKCWFTQLTNLPIVNSTDNKFPSDSDYTWY